MTREPAANPGEIPQKSKRCRPVMAVTARIG
jgi:hypothetical protein